MGIESCKVKYSFYLEICNMLYEPLGLLTDGTSYSAYDIEISKTDNDATKLNFTISEKSPKFKYLVNENMVLMDGEYYIIKKITLEESADYSYRFECEHEICSYKEKLNGKIEMIGESPENLINEVCTNVTSPLPIRFGGTDIIGKYRHLISDEQSVFSNLVSIAEVFGARLIFKKINGIIHVWLLANPKDKGRFVEKKRDLDSVNLEYDSNEMFTRLHYFGGSDNDTGNEITMHDVNPTGKSYVEDFSYYLNQGYTLEEVKANPNCIREMTIRNPDLTTPEQIYQMALQELGQICKPKMTASINIIDLQQLKGYILEPIEIGDLIRVYDKTRNLNLEATVTGINKRSENPLDIGITLSNVIEINSALKDLVNSSQTIDRVTNGGNTVQGVFVSIGDRSLKTELFEHSTQISGNTTQINDNKASIEANTKEIAMKVSESEYKKDQTIINDRITEAEFQIRPDQITATVTQNKTFTNIIDGAKAEMDAESTKKLNEYKETVDKEFGDVGLAIKNAKDYVDGAFKDGILTETEKEGIKVQINQIEVEEKDVGKQYAEIYHHSLLINKVTLKQTYEQYKTTSRNLITFLTSMLTLANIEIGHANEKDRLFTLYKEHLGMVKVKITMALDEIALNRNNNLQNNVEEKFATLDVSLDKINIAVGENTETIAQTTEIVNGIQIGTRNYIRNADAKADKEFWTGVDNFHIGGSGMKYLMKKRTGYVGTDRCFISQNVCAYTMKNGLSVNTPIVFSGFYFVNTSIIPFEGGQLFVRCYKKDSPTGEFGDICVRDIAASTTQLSGSFEISGKTPFDCSRVDVQLAITKNGELGFAQPKLEKGTRKTDFSIAPEDISDRTDKAKDDAIKYANDLKAATDKEINDVSTSITDLNTTMNTAFKDGIISESEAIAIKENLKRCDKEKLEADKQYNVLYADTSLIGTAKTNLLNAKNDYNSKYTDLTNYIKNVIADGKATTSEIANIDTKNTAYNTSNATLVQRVGEATKSIEDKKKQDAINSANNHTNSQITETNKKVTENKSSIDILKNQISLTVSQSQLEETKVQIGTDIDKSKNEAIDYTDTEIKKANDRVAGIDIKIDGITSKVTNVETEVKKVDGKVVSNTTRIESAENKITPTAITSSVSEQLNNGGKIDVTSMKIDKTGIETLHDGYSTKVASGWTTCSEPNGDWTYRLGRFFDLYCGKIGTAKDYIGGVRGFIGASTGKKQMDVVVDADVSKGLGIGYTVGSGGSADASKDFIRFNPGGWMHAWTGMNFNNFEIRKLHPNMDTSLDMFSGYTYHHSNCIDTNHSGGNLVFNYHKGYNTTVASKVYVNDGTKTGNRGIIYVKSVDAKSALRQVQNTNTGIKASYGVTATRDFIDDLYFGTIDENGEAIVMLSQEFLSQVDTTTKYHVQVTGYNGGTFKIERNQTFIRLTGASNEEFSISVRCVSKQNLETMKAIERDTMYDEKYMHHSLLDIINDKEKEQLDKFKLNRLADESNRKSLKILMQTAQKMEESRHDK
ncbi:MAG: phage tail protein [Sarcina sp.]